MAWFKEKQNTSYIRNFCSNVLKSGEIPKHVAIIMDGNRRFAKKVNCERSKGHEKGFEKLTEVLEWCFELGIPEVTVYAFSIENFKRSKDEVECLMELAKQKFDRLLEERHVLNVCMAYTSRHEICEAIKTMAKAVEDGALKPMDISENVLDQCLYTHQSPEPDLLIRTSGEVRFSDFLLWQCSYTSLSFLKVLWPEFSVWNFYSAILSYQWNFTAIQKIRQDAQKDKIHKEMEADLEVVLNELRAENVCVSNGSSSSNGTRVEKYQDKKRERIERFLSGLDELRTDYLDRMCTVQS
ncbi:predicted protein [Nematostella vectensis]|uniref:Alkyl transferase n=1 Tax=Nematostella vectensis TaxID=45351 RepID=A7SBV2_NEMVE|nr:predicted protein [Nematostella vectensis]|eukprot:XP_001630894.1 predicted protein [Nematostella vectensis]